MPTIQQVDHEEVNVSGSDLATKELQQPTLKKSPSKASVDSEHPLARVLDAVAETEKSPKKQKEEPKMGSSLN